MAKSAKKSTVKAGEVWSLAKIDATIASITKKGHALRTECHQCLVAVIDHYIANGDFTRLPKLLQAIKTSLGGSVSQSAAEWVMRYVTSLSWSEDAKKEQAKLPADKNMLGFFHIPKVEKKIKENVERKIKDAKGDTVKIVVPSAREIPFYELERNVEIRPFDLIASLQAVLKRAQKAVEQNHDKSYEGPKHLINDEQFELLKAMEENIENLKASKKAKAARAAAAKKAGTETSEKTETTSEGEGEAQGSVLGETVTE